MGNVTTYQEWLQRLKQMRGNVPAIASADEKNSTSAGYGSAKSAKSRNTDPFAEARQCATDEDVAWRVAAFRARIPEHGPIWPPRICDTAACDMPGHCSLCGDELTADPIPRFPRCQPCIHALWLALNERHEGVDVGVGA